MADPQTHHAQLAADWINPVVAGLDELLRPVLPDTVASSPPAHQFLPDALGSQ